MISFLAESEEAAVELVARTKLFRLAESLGGVESMIEHPARMTHASTADAPFAAPKQPDPRLGRDRVRRRPDRRPRGRARPRRRARQVTDCYLDPPAEPIDLHHAGAARTVGAYLLETSAGLALFDCGPSSCIPTLKAGLAERGHELGDVTQLLLSHIHLDHAGAAGSLVREHPALQVWVSEVGAPHLVDPVPAGAKRETPLRRHVRRALGRAGARPRGQRADRGRSRCGPRGLPVTGPRLAPRLLLRRRARSTRATPRASGSSRAAPSCRRHHLRTSTSRPGTARSSRSSGGRPSGWR